MRDYRINVRFHEDIDAERRAAEYLKSLDRSRNQFVVDAVIAQMEATSLLENIRLIVREEMRQLPKMPSNASSEFPAVVHQEEAIQNILADLEMFD